MKFNNVYLNDVFTIAIWSFLGQMLFRKKIMRSLWLGESTSILGLVFEVILVPNITLQIYFSVFFWKCIELCFVQLHRKRNLFYYRNKESHFYRVVFQNRREKVWFLISSRLNCDFSNIWTRYLISKIFYPCTLYGKVCFEKQMDQLLRTIHPMIHPSIGNITNKKNNEILVKNGQKILQYLLYCTVQTRVHHKSKSLERMKKLNKSWFIILDVI